MIKTLGFINNSKKDKHMTKQELQTTTANLTKIAEEVFKHGTKTQKEEIGDVAKLNIAIMPYVAEMKAQGSNYEWNEKAIQNAIYDCVEYNPKDKENKNSPFEMRVIRASVQSVLVMTSVNPNCFGEYKNGSWAEFGADVSATKSANYNVKFDDDNGYRFNEKGQLQLPSKSLLPVIEQDVKTAKGSKKERFQNPSDTIVNVSQSIADGHFRKAFPQAKATRESKGVREATAYKSAENLTKFVNGKTETYKAFVDSKGTRGNAEAVSEINAKVLQKLQTALDNFMNTRDEAEMYAEELEEKLSSVSNVA